MATNIVRPDGLHIPVAVSNPTTPVSGDPVRFGEITGLAQTDEGDGGNAATDTSVDFGFFVCDVSVDDNGGSGIAVGDIIYYHDTGTGSPSTHLNNSSAYADAIFGIALEAVGANATATIQVLHILQVL